MVFSSTIFLCVYLPLVLLGYYICPKKGRNLFLLIVSLVFYAWGEPKYVFLMIFSILVNYIFGRLMDKNRGRQKRMKLLLVLSVVIDLGLLSVFKYTDFIITNVNAIFGSSFDLLNIALPIGISFYTFQAMSYTIDVYRNDVRVQKNLIDFGMYITMFPQLIAGPIVRYADVQDQLADRSVTTADFSEGVMRFVVGLGKKVLLANQLGGLWRDVTTIGFESLSTPLAWMAAFAYSFQLYFDFWGYSLMAIGIGRMLGFHIPENFRCPYLALSMTEFWRRWHITLGTWFREYLYIPLGGSHCSRKRMIFNLLVVWLATGLWHGAHLNFLLWGLGLFAVLVVEKLWLKKYLDRWPILGHLYMLVLIPVSWAVFSVSDFGQLGAYFGRLFPLFSRTAAAYPLDFLKYGKTYGVFLILGLLCSTSLPAYLYRRFKSTWVGAVILAVLFWLCLYCLSKGMNDPFMYFRF